MGGNCKASKQTDIKIHIGPNSERTNNMEQNQGNVESSRGGGEEEGHYFLGTVILYPFITITMINLRLFLFLNKQD